MHEKMRNRTRKISKFSRFRGDGIYMYQGRSQDLDPGGARPGQKKIIDATENK